MRSCFVMGQPLSSLPSPLSGLVPVDLIWNTRFPNLEILPALTSLCSLSVLPLMGFEDCGLSSLLGVLEEARMS